MLVRFRSGALLKKSSRSGGFFIRTRKGRDAPAVRGARQSFLRVLSAIVTDVPAWQGVVNLYSAVTGENVKSKNMHLKTGFRSVGVFRNAGFKGGKWHDIEYFEKQIGAYAAPPHDPVPAAQMPAGEF